MSFKDILVHVDSTPPSRSRLRLALSLAHRFGARLSGLHLIPEPEIPPYFKPSAVARIAKIYTENANATAGLAETLFREETTTATVETAWECVAADIAEMIAERARFADLAILGQFDTENPSRLSAFLLPAKVVFGTAAPILVVPNTDVFHNLGNRILVTWDGSRESARAIQDAMPFLNRAEQVSLLAVDPFRQAHMYDGAKTAEMAAHLERHGIRVSLTEIDSGKWNVTDTLLAHAAKFGADLLVMGAYGHSRIWEFAVGGTTQDVLERTTLPVLISR